MKVSSEDVVLALRRAGSQFIPDAYYLAAAKHETTFDTSLIGDNRRSYGIFQISPDLGAEAGESVQDLLTLDGAARAMVYLAERNRDEIRAAIGLTSADRDPWDMGAYLSIAHNQGLGAAFETIKNFGMNWTAYVERNKDRVRYEGSQIVFNGPRIVVYGNDSLYDPVTGEGIALRRSRQVNLAFGLLAVFSAAGIGIWLSRR